MSGTHAAGLSDRPGQMDGSLHIHDLGPGVDRADQATKIRMHVRRVDGPSIEGGSDRRIFHVQHDPQIGAGHTGLGHSLVAAGRPDAGRGQPGQGVAYLPGDDFGQRGRAGLVTLAVILDLNQSAADSRLDGHDVGRLRLNNVLKFFGIEPELIVFFGGPCRRKSEGYVALADR